jgi:hypothetical protein
MKKVYVILQGDYSDVRIIGVFLNKEDADKYIHYADDDCLYDYDERPYIEEHNIMSAEDLVLIKKHPDQDHILYVFDFYSLEFVEKRRALLPLYSAASRFSRDKVYEDEYYVKVKKSNGISTHETKVKKFINVLISVDKAASSDKRFKIATDRAAQLKADYLNNQGD